MYRQTVKPVLDLLCAMAVFACFAPLFAALAVVGAVVLRGNPFFVQPRPGKDGAVFDLVKFRTMTDERGADGNLLPDERRLVPWGRFLRATSLDELPEFWNVLKGEMSVVGPRPLLVEYLPLYDERQRHRHDVRPGLTGLAQINGRNGISWEEKFEYDLAYVKNLSFALDLRIVALTAAKILEREGINAENGKTMEPFRGNGGKA